MKKLYIFILTVVLLLVSMEKAFASVTCHIQTAGTTGSWVNELGSIAVITVDNNGNVFGKYTDGTGTNAIGPLVGFCNGDAISFTVGWTGFKTITSWIGTWKNNRIVTLWHFVDGASSQWNNTNAGTNTFTKQQ